MKLEIRLVSSLEKVFMDEPMTAAPFHTASALKGEVFSFQAAIRNRTPDGEPSRQYSQVMVQFTLDSKLPAEIREVRSVPVDVPCNRAGETYLRTTPGMYPDLLTALPGGFFRFPADQWRSFWITVRIPEKVKAGRYPVRLAVTQCTIDQTPLPDADRQEAVFDLNVLPAKLPAQQLLRYEWFHSDCLHTYYHVPCWSEEHWRILENFVFDGVRHGLNVLMTPLWSIPLDTAVGGERPTTQLLKITKKGAKYTFDFTLLERYVEMGLRCGITHFAMTHFFTQWGANATPKIVVTEGGKEKKLFGWHVPAKSPEYANFLKQLLPKLLKFFRDRGLGKNILFSISDEPHGGDQLESYGFASNLVEPLIEDCPAIDALSRVEFYEKGLVKHPVPSNNHIEDFVGKVKELNTYYCISQEEKVPNRFMAMSSARNRVMGVMFYLYNIHLFLQWGFNFYYSQHSLHPVDPYRNTCADNWTPAGDAFIVYPGPDGKPEDSLRHEVFFDAIQDLRALRALEKKIGRKATVALIQQGVPYPIKMAEYPHSADWLLQLRERVNRALTA